MAWLLGSNDHFLEAVIIYHERFLGSSHDVCMNIFLEVAPASTQTCLLCSPICVKFSCFFHWQDTVFVKFYKMKCWCFSWSIQFSILAIFVTTFCFGKLECQPTMPNIICYSTAMLREFRPQGLSSCEHTQRTFPQHPGRKMVRKEVGIVKLSSF
ncbi:hypothetical protein EGW08_023116 [Elysia chlorotica]|uniref:Uncharacterized protein n=1 Tax=Elysia chlorotica TaxID=188477 RepID=A0A3S1AV40_ELYCH|nr:hypothetical protein EGW08_023116 [Elysia chlorotica]